MEDNVAKTMKARQAQAAAVIIFCCIRFAILLRPALSPVSFFRSSMIKMVIDLFEIFLETFRLQVSLTAVQQYVGDGAAIKYAPKGNQENGNGIHNEPKKPL